MRVPAERSAVDAAVRDLDEGHAALDQPAREQTALAEQVAAVAIAYRVLLFFDVERLGGRSLHQPHCPVVGGLVALGGDAGTTLDEVILHLLEQIDASIGVLGVNVAGQVEILYLEGGLVAGPSALLLREVLGRVADD